MNYDPRDLENALAKLGRIATPDAPLVDPVMRSIAGMPQPVRHQPRKLIARLVIGLAACLVIGLITVVSLRDGGATITYAQVIKALSEVTSLHAVGQRLDQDGRPYAGVEVSYERSVALKLVSHTPSRDGGSLTLVRDGKQEVSIIDDGPKLGRRPTTTQPAKEDNETLLAKELNLDGFKDRVQRDPSGDREVGGVPCRMFVWMRRPVMRICYWIGSDNWVRRQEEQELHPETKQWVPQFMIEISYNVPIDRDLLKMPEVNSR